MTDFRALCVELTDCLEKSDWPHQYKPVFEQWIYIARKALAEPEPEAPTDQELNNTYWKAWHGHFDRTNSVLHAVGLRAVLARWGNHPASPDSSTQVQ
jgi:hypothetical protein